LPASDLPLLRAAADEAGRIALRFWRKAPAAWDKPGGEGPVTEADLAVDRMLAAELRAARPGYGWLSEETPDHPVRLEHERVFIVDPIDGTRAFVAGEPQFAHALAVAEAGRITAAVVLLPAEGLTYAAAVGGGATRNGAPIAPRARPEDEAVALASAASLGAQHWPGGVPPLRRAFRASLAYRLCLVAEGAFDAALTFRPTWEWDAAAPSLIAAAAGARVTDGAGADPAFNRPDPRIAGLIVAGPALHARLMARRGG
jgi:myo-inositol-1(or 4)-monophosphatase